MKGYYFITDSGLSSKGDLADVREALSAGVKIVQYRQKTASALSMYAQALAMKKECAGSGASFLVNDRVDIALAVDADGVHLGQEDIPYEQARKILGKDKIIGLSVKTLEQAIFARDSGVDYIGLGPIFATNTKSDAGKPLGTDMLRRIKETVDLPLVAIGGINFDNAALVVEAGADALCAISAVIGHSDSVERIGRFQSIFSERNRE